MPNSETTTALFKLAITAEKTAQDFYLELVKKFSHLPEVSDFWKEMQKDEIQHAQELENIRDSMTPNQLLAPADPSVMQKAKKVLKFSVKDSLNSIRTLDDAYELAHELEYSEVNTVFAFLTTKFISSDERKKFVLSEIEDHLTKLMDFSQTFGNAEWRKGIVIRPHRAASDNSSSRQGLRHVSPSHVMAKRRKVIKV